jgi:glutamate--cysteine ligase
MRAQAPLSFEDLVQDLEKGIKAPHECRIGIEHEKFLYTPDWRRLSYENGIADVLEQFHKREGWCPILENDTLIAVQSTKNPSASVSLEPGGQLELSGAPYADLHQAISEINEHLEKLQGFVKPGTQICFAGFDSYTEFEDIPWMPKQRYALMRQYMPTRGQLGTWMMTRTATVQVNLDFTSETDMINKWRVSLAVQPIISGLFANSPYTYQGQNVPDFRQRIWQDTDSDRCGFLPFVFEDTMGFAAYVEYMLDVPMYFVYRQGVYIDALGQSFRDFMRGQLSAMPGVYATIEDWHQHLTTAFPEVRLKRYLELRSADVCPPPLLFALPALWVGLLYDATALDDALQLIRNWPVTDIRSLVLDLPNVGLNFIHQGRSCWRWASQFVDIARAGLKRRNLGEEVYLDPLADILSCQQTRAEKFAHHTPLDFLRENCL